jgi:6-pyruvoyltetrahydropterin/6-carboxytetrahydropterin synthase
MITAQRYHDFSYGHRVYGHESKCAHLHGHNGRVHFKVTAPNLDQIGRVLDFSAIKNLLCNWVEDNWDHKFLVWERDPWASKLKDTDPAVVFTSFIPTAENMAEYLVNVIGPRQLEGTGCILVECTIEETRKCSVTYSKG